MTKAFVKNPKDSNIVYVVTPDEANHAENVVVGECYNEEFCSELGWDKDDAVDTHKYAGKTYLEMGFIDTVNVHHVVEEIKHYTNDWTESIL